MLAKATEREISGNDSALVSGAGRDGAGGCGPAGHRAGDWLHHCCWNYTGASLGQAKEKLSANEQTALNHSHWNRLEIWPAEASQVDTAIAPNRGEQKRDRDACGADRNVAVAGFRVPFHPGRHCVI